MQFKITLIKKLTPIVNIIFTNSINLYICKTVRPTLELNA